VLSGEGREGEERCASPALVLPPPISVMSAAFGFRVLFGGSQI